MDPIPTKLIKYLSTYLEDSSLLSIILGTLERSIDCHPEVNLAIMDRRLRVEAVQGVGELLLGRHQGLDQGLSRGLDDVRGRLDRRRYGSLRVLDRDGGRGVGDQSLADGEPVLGGRDGVVQAFDRLVDEADDRVGDHVDIHHGTAVHTSGYVRRYVGGEHTCKTQIRINQGLINIDIN